MTSQKLEDKININSPNINLLKFIGAIAVVVSHQSSITFGKDDFLIELSHGQCSLGGVAVSFFFFISGLYVAKSLARSDSVSDYLKKRCIRIFPQLWIVIVASIIAGAFLSEFSFNGYFHNTDTYKYLLNCFLVIKHNLPGVFEDSPYQTFNGPLWTLPVEFASYLSLAVIAGMSLVIFKRINDSTRLVLDSIAFCTIGILLIIVFALGGVTGTWFSVLRAVIFFYEGVLYYDLRKNIKLNPVIGLIFLVFLIVLIHSQFFNIGLIILLPYALISLALGLPQIMINCPVFELSYEMYLVGWPIQQIIRSCFAFGRNPYFSCIVAIVLDVIVGGVLYLTTEKVLYRFSRVKKRKI